MQRWLNPIGKRRGHSCISYFARPEGCGQWPDGKDVGRGVSFEFSRFDSQTWPHFSCCAALLLMSIYCCDSNRIASEALPCDQTCVIRNGPLEIMKSNAKLTAVWLQPHLQHHSNHTLRLLNLLCNLGRSQDASRSIWPSKEHAPVMGIKEHESWL